MIWMGIIGFDESDFRSFELSIRVHRRFKLFILSITEKVPKVNAKFRVGKFYQDLLHQFSNKMICKSRKSLSLVLFFA